MSKATRMWRVHRVAIDIDADPDRALPERVAKMLEISARAIRSVSVVKKSFDARRRPRFVYTVDAEVAPGARVRPPKDAKPSPDPLALPERRAADPGHRVAVVGAGPAGLFTALTLARAGLRPVLFDRGKPVETRGKDVGALINKGRLDPESNLCFGEGGAGTWSDGKLTTRISAVEIRSVLNTLHEFGGPARILTDGKPHLGTDKLVKILKAFRKALIELEVDVRYGVRVDDLVIRDGRVVGVEVDGQNEAFDSVVLAVGHSARELYERLVHHGLDLERKPFALGFRVEHPQALINEIQYGAFAEHPSVPTADYRVSANFGSGDQRRGVYSFCMCPGGVIMPTATRHDEVVVNGMSNASRSGRWANSAIVVTVSPEEYGAWGEGPLAGAEFQRSVERAAAELGGGAFKAPGQTVPDYLAGRPSQTLRKTTYRPGVTPTDLSGLFPASLTDALKRALIEFDQTLPGFITEEAVLHGVETRTSAPVRIVRGEDRSATRVAGLYPVGEGAGYAGGIVSAGVDGIKSAMALLDQLES